MNRKAGRAHASPCLIVSCCAPGHCDYQPAAGHRHQLAGKGGQTSLGVGGRSIRLCGQDRMLPEHSSHGRAVWSAAKVGVVSAAGSAKVTPTCRPVPLPQATVRHSPGAAAARLPHICIVQCSSHSSARLSVPSPVASAAGDGAPQHEADAEPGAGHRRAGEHHAQVGWGAKMNMFPCAPKVFKIDPKRS